MKIILMFIITLLSSPCIAKEEYENIMDVSYISCFDGDTCKFNIKDIPDIFGKNINVRLYGIDTPEIRAKCKKEKDAAYIARDYVRNILENSSRVDLITPSRGKYFRIVADVQADGKSISEELIESGLAVPYYGKNKIKNWCE